MERKNIYCLGISENLQLAHLAVDTANSLEWKLQKSFELRSSSILLQMWNNLSCEVHEGKADYIGTIVPLIVMIADNWYIFFCFSVQNQQMTRFSYL